MHFSRRETSPREILSSKNLSRIGVPRLFFDCEVEDFEGEDHIKKLIQRYCNNIHDMFEDSVNLTFYGSNGNGKTFLTSLILKNAYYFRYTAKRITLKRYIDLKFMPSIQKDSDIWEEINAVDNAEFLVIDEVGKEPNTKNGGSVSVFEELMKYREELGYPTIICTNLNLDDIKEKYGTTLSSMIGQSVRIEMVGDDMRNTTFKRRNGVSILFDEEED